MDLDDAPVAEQPASSPSAELLGRVRTWIPANPPSVSLPRAVLRRPANRLPSRRTAQVMLALAALPVAGAMLVYAQFSGKGAPTVHRPPAAAASVAPGASRPPTSTVPSATPLPSASSAPPISSKGEITVPVSRPSTPVQAGTKPKAASPPPQASTPHHNPPTGSDSEPTDSYDYYYYQPAPDPEPAYEPPAYEPPAYDTYEPPTYDTYEPSDPWSGGDGCQAGSGLVVTCS